MNCNNGNNDGHVGSAPPAVVASPLPVKVASAAALGVASAAALGVASAAALGVASAGAVADRAGVGERVRVGALIYRPRSIFIRLVCICGA